MPAPSQNFDAGQSFTTPDHAYFTPLPLRTRQMLHLSTPKSCFRQPGPALGAYESITIGRMTKLSLTVRTPGVDSAATLMAFFSVSELSVEVDLARPRDQDTSGSTSPFLLT